MLNLLGFLVALPFVALALLLLLVFSPFAFVDALGAGVAIFGAVLAVFLVAGVVGLVGTIVTGVLGLVGTVLGAVLGLLLPLAIVVVAFGLVVALIPLLVPIAIVVAIVWLAARASRNDRAPRQLPHAVA